QLGHEGARQEAGHRPRHRRAQGGEGSERRVVDHCTNADYHTVKLVVYLAVFAGAAVVLSLVSFWLAVRPPRLAVPLTPGDVGLTVENLTITADDGVPLAAWLVPRA